MKKLILILIVCLSIQTIQAQKGKITDAQLALQDNKILDAKKSIDAAFQDTNALRMVKAWSTKGDVYKAIYDSKIFYATNPNCLFDAKDAYLKALELESNPKKQKDYSTPLNALYGYLFNEGYERFSNKKYDDAYKHFAASTAINQLLFSKGYVSALDTNAIFATAMAGANSGKNDEIIPLLEKLITLKLDNPAVYETLAQIYEIKNNKEELSKVVEKGLKLYPNNKNLQVYELNSALDGNDVQKSIDKFEKAAQNDPSNASIVFNLAVLYDKINNTEKALQYYQKSIELKPDYSDAYFNMGVMYFNQGVQLNKKMNDVDEKADRDGKIYDGLKKQRDEQFNKALPFLEKAYQINPNNKEYKSNLKKVYASMNLFDKAKALGE